MLALTERPAHPSGAHAVYCERCQNPRPLAVVSPGTLTFRMKHQERTVTGLTPRQRIWAKCACGHSQEIIVPKEGQP
jgi:hypothetical protein